ncbi:MAG: hypothetical protein KKC68_03030 [Candidatus Thermoplasmatota archaeon]|nr:hypothetical protein [Candidatus Thermoplasmatota archaeon]MBU1940727.1 hypothetical protein [Candidatus Thermoplasmatota archaeon]
MSKRSLRAPLIPFIAFLVFSCGVFPLAILGWIFIHFIPFTNWWHFLLLPFILYIAAGILYISELLISGGFIKLFKITYQLGIYPYSLTNPMFYRWMIICTLYTPMRKLLEMFPLGNMKNTYYRLLGMKIGTNTLVGGVIKDPCLTEFGDNVTMGEYAIVYGHIHNMEKQTIEMNRVQVGNNCVIGAGAIIMPGAVLEDNTVVAAGGLVPKNQHLSGNTIYGGVPVKPLRLNQPNQQ